MQGFELAGIFRMTWWPRTANLFRRMLWRAAQMSSDTPPLAALAPGVSAAGKLDRADIEALAQAGTRTIVNNRPDGEDPGQLPAVDARRLAEDRGMSYHHIPVTAASLTRTDVDALAAVLDSAERPIVLHCRSGTRSTLLWALVRLREGADPSALIAEAARQGIDIAALPAIAERMR
jgi:sulfide:quinone oxidoreductase